MSSSWNLTNKLGYDEDRGKRKRCSELDGSDGTPGRRMGLQGNMKNSVVTQVSIGGFGESTTAKELTE